MRCVQGYTRGKHPEKVDGRGMRAGMRVMCAMCAGCAGYTRGKYPEKVYGRGMRGGMRAMCGGVHWGQTPRSMGGDDTAAYK